MDLLGRPGAPVDEHLTEGSVGDDAGVVVDAAVSFGLADDGNDAVGLDHPVVDQLGEPGGIADTLDRHFSYFNGILAFCVTPPFL